MIEKLESLIPGTEYDHWLVLLVLASVVFAVLDFIRTLAAKTLKKLASKTETKWDDLVAELILGMKHWAVFMLALVLALPFSRLEPRPAGVIHKIAIVLAFVQVGLWGGMVVNQWVAGKSASSDGQQASLTGYKVLGALGKVVLWSILLLLTLDNLGVNVTALVAGLGVGGVAVALAVQNILGDIFCSFTILLDKPFEVGDAINVGDITGEVVQVGIKTTRIRSITGEEVVLSNADLVGSRIRNFRRMNERRAIFALGVVYGTSREKLEKIPGLLQGIIQAESQVRFDRSHFKSFGVSSLDFETVYWVLDRDYKVFMDVQHRINLEIFRRFEAEGIEFAYPTQTVYVNGQPAKAAL